MQREAGGRVHDVEVPAQRHEDGVDLHGEEHPREQEGGGPHLRVVHEVKVPLQPRPRRALGVQVLVLWMKIAVLAILHTVETVVTIRQFISARLRRARVVYPLMYRLI